MKIGVCNASLSAAAFTVAMIMQPAWAIDPPIRVLLVGDSTMAPETGYGNALCQRFQPNVTCLNLARGGRSSSSYRAEGLWDHVTDLLKDGGHYQATYVLVQFGHNDQPGKPGRSTDLATEFPQNMARYAQQVKALHAIPVLVTPLSRRSFQDNSLKNDLLPWAMATRKVAAAEQVLLLDLNADSAAAVQAMGSAEADTLAMAPPPVKSEPEAQAATDNAAAKPKSNSFRGFDYTHLGAKGASLFSHMVAQELASAVPALVPDFKSEK